MALVNGNYLKLKAGYLFPEIGRRVKAFSEANPNAALIRLGIGDVTEPLPQACRDAMKNAIDEMGTRDGFHGYGPCLLYTSPSPRDLSTSRMPSSA